MVCKEIFATKNRVGGVTMAIKRIKKDYHSQEMYKFIILSLPAQSKSVS